MLAVPSYWFLLILILALGAGGMQQGDREEEAQPEIWRQFNVPAAPALTPEEALDSFKIAPGFRVELVAAEPLVVDPVMLSWDADGRMWVVEFRGWMPNVDGIGEDDPVGQIAVLEDTDGDGTMDRRTTFLDQLVLPRALAIVEGGVLVAEPPALWYCQDTDGDLTCDRKTRVVDYGQQGNPEHTDNGLMRALDNWIYSANSAFRIKFEGGEIVREETAFRGQWGITQDDYGRLFTNTNSNFLYGDLIPYEYLRRNPRLKETIGINVNVIDSDEHEVHTIRVNPGINRGYRSDLRPDGRLSRPTAASGPVIYRGDQFPDAYYGNAFVPLPAGNVVCAFILQENEVGFESRHRLYEDEEWGRREFLASTDERFRPVNLYTGPDGSLYVVDLYRGILEHKLYMTTFLRKQILERGLDKPVGLGRIYRVVSKGKEPGTTRPMLSKATAEELIGHLSHPNGWWRDMAQRLLVERKDFSVLPALRTVARDGASHQGRLHALWALEGLEAVDLETVLDGLRDAHPQVRIAALRVGESLLQTEHRPTLLDQFGEMLDEEDRQVRIQLLLTLGEAAAEAGSWSLMLRLLDGYAADPYVRQAAISGLSGLEPDFLKRVLENWAEEGAGYAEFVAELTSSLYRGRDAAQIEELLSLTASETGRQSWQQEAVLEGMVRVAGEPGYLPVELSEKPEDFLPLTTAEDQTIKELAAQVYSAVTWSGDSRPRVLAKLKPLSPADARLAEQGKQHYETHCAVCHRADGRGQPGLAPSLVNTPWVLDSPDRLIRIVLDGMAGPVAVHDQQWDMIMPGFRTTPFFRDEEVAAALTYVRRAWGHAASPVRPVDVEKIRQATAGRSEPWTVEELEKLPSASPPGNENQ